jgi:hypothetical protein
MARRTSGASNAACFLSNPPGAMPAIASASSNEKRFFSCRFGGMRWSSGRCGWFGTVFRKCS